MRTITLILIATLMTTALTVPPVAADHGATGEIRDADDNLIAEMEFKSAAPLDDPTKQTWTFTWYNMTAPSPVEVFVPIVDNGTTISTDDVPTSVEVTEPVNNTTVSVGVDKDAALNQAVTCDAVGSVEEGFVSVDTLIYENTYAPGGRNVGVTTCVHAFETSGTGDAHAFPNCYAPDVHQVSYKFDTWTDGLDVRTGTAEQTILETDNAIWCPPIVIDPCTLNVPSDFATIQDALDVAVDEDVVCAAAGQYNESLDIKPSSVNVTLLGAGSRATIIDAGEDAWGIDARESVGLTLEGFAITNASAYGLKLFKLDGLTLKDIHAYENGKTGVDLHTVSDVKMSGIRAIDNGGNGVTIRNATGVSLSGSSISGNSWGGLAFYAPENETVNGTRIVGNAFADHGGPAVYFQYDGFTNVTVRANEYRNNGVGVAVDDVYGPIDPSGIRVVENSFLGNSLGVSNAGDNTLDARGNYWGHVAGPHQGDSVVGNVSFAPWCFMRGCFASSLLP